MGQQYREDEHDRDGRDGNGGHHEQQRGEQVRGGSSGRYRSADESRRWSESERSPGWNQQHGQGSQGGGQGQQAWEHRTSGLGEGRYLYEQEKYGTRAGAWGADPPQQDDGRFRSQQRGQQSSMAGGSFWNSDQGSGAQRQTFRGQTFRGKGPKGYERSDDRLREMICERLTEDDEIDASEVSIEVKSGEVTLSGTVDDRRLKYQIEDLVERCGGVKDIHNHLRVQREGQRPGAQGQQHGASQQQSQDNENKNDQSAPGKPSSRQQTSRSGSTGISGSTGV